MNDKYVKTCPYCGSNEMIETTNSMASAASVSTGLLKMKAARLYHSVCLGCGSVVRSYVKEEDIKKLK